MQGRIGGMAVALVLVAVVAACGRENEILDTQRVTSSPRPTISATAQATSTPDATAPSQTSSAVVRPPAPPTITPDTPSPTVAAKQLDGLKIKLTEFAKVPRPTAMAIRKGDPALYIASKPGRVWRLRGSQQEVILDIASETATGFEQGLLGLAFTPDGSVLVINFTDKNDSSVTRAYRFGADGALLDLDSGNDLLVVQKPTKIHNAGNLAFGPDGYLYLSLGDGGKSGDPDNNAQSLGTLLGKIHRINVRPDLTYTIPSSNPFVGRKGARGEIWAYGFRNPWRFSFDRKTGDLWVADVGSGKREEIDFEPAKSGGGRNYGWARMEGSIPYQDREPPKEHVLPVHDYGHEDGRCAVTGGYVYRGTKISALYGAYLFSDYCRGGVEALILRGGRVAEHRLFESKKARFSSFGEDATGELYALGLTDDTIYRIERA